MGLDLHVGTVICVGGGEEECHWWWRLGMGNLWLHVDSGLSHPPLPTRHARTSPSYPPSGNELAPLCTAFSLPAAHLWRNIRLRRTVRVVRGPGEVECDPLYCSVLSPSPHIRPPQSFLSSLVFSDLEMFTEEILNKCGMYC